MKRGYLILLGLACITMISCGAERPYASDNDCADGVCADFNVTANPYDVEGEGFITLSDNERYFQYQNGTPFIPIGHNGWYDAPLYLDTERLDRYFSVMNEHGENTLRVLLDYSGIVSPILPYLKTRNLVELEVGEFNPELIDALDNLVDAAERHGIYLLISFLPNLYDNIRNGNWFQHPYNKNFDPENGLVDSPEDLLVDAAAIQAVKERIYFFIERWGASPNIFAWELWNEMNAIGGTPEQHNEWIREMGAFTKQLEMKLYGRHHLRTVSTNNAGWGSAEAGIYSSSELDFTSYHTYDASLKVGINPFEGLPMWSRVDPIKYMQFIYASAQLTQQKSVPRPILGTEDMNIIRNSAGGLLTWPLNQYFEGYTREQLDDFFIGAAWASVLGGGAGPSFRYPCYPKYGEDDPEGYLPLSYGMYDGQKALREILSTIDWGDSSPTSANHAVSAQDTQDILPMALFHGNNMIAFFLNENPEFSRAEVSPHVTFRSLQHASYRVTWYDLRSGDVLQNDWTQGPEFSLQAPTFETFVGAVVTRVAPR